MFDWSNLAIMIGAMGLPAFIAAFFELRAWRQRRRGESLPAGRWPPAEPDWKERLGPGRGRAFAFDEELHKADAEARRPDFGAYG